MQNGAERMTAEIKTVQPSHPSRTRWLCAQQLPAVCLLTTPVYTIKLINVNEQPKPCRPCFSVALQWRAIASFPNHRPELLQLRRIPCGSELLAAAHKLPVPLMLLAVSGQALHTYH